MEAKDRLIVALDIHSIEARVLVERLDGLISWFKVGPALLIQSRGAALDHLRAEGKRIFLDLKFFEVPDSMVAACLQAIWASASMVSVHCLNGQEALRKCKEAVGGPLADPPKILGVTVLTSHSFETLERLRLLRNYDEVCRGMMTDGLRGEGREQIKDLTLRLGQEARDAGLDGVVASPLEAPAVRSAFGPSFTIVTPGIRFAGDAGDNHVYTATPREAILAGADYIVMGRAITAADDPLFAAHRAVGEIAAAMRERG